MLVRSQVINALETKKERFARYETGLREHAYRFHAGLEQLSSLSCAEVEARLAASGAEWPGARPTAEHDRVRGTSVEFGIRWDNHAAARTWAMGVLRDQPTFAVDGSQIPLSGDFSVPVAAVQVGWFENPHAPGQPYVKDIAFDVLAPDELAAEIENSEAGAEDGARAAFPDTVVNLRRFEGECRTLGQYMEAHGDCRPAPVCFFDGALVVSFVRQLSPPLRQAYLDAVTGMLRTSETTRVPLVGYVDTSHARDLTHMVSRTFGLPPPAHLTDGGLLSPHLQWGDRSPTYWCARDDGVLSLYDPQARRVAFTYLKTTADGNPARIELPGWLCDNGTELARTLNLVRAECIVGNGYPYALETADAVAVISTEDRQRFYAMFQQFAEQAGLAMRYSRKARSKATRR